MLQLEDKGLEDLFKLGSAITFPQSHSTPEVSPVLHALQAFRTTRKCPAETNLSSNLAFFFFPPNQIFRCH